MKDITKRLINAYNEADSKDLAKGKRIETYERGGD